MRRGNFLTVTRTDVDDDLEAGATPYVPRSKSIETLANAAEGCRGCPLYKDTTQVVFGRGPKNALLILVGEQPGAVEDKRGLPFVGPAGAVLWQCVEDAGIDRQSIYATNAVKHFKHEIRGKRRIHKTPNAEEIAACHPWIDAELNALTGSTIVALGAVATRSLLGKSLPIGKSRDTTFTLSGRSVVVTYHPSAVLRADDRAAEIRAALVHDLRRAARIASGTK